MFACLLSSAKAKCVFSQGQQQQQQNCTTLHYATSEALDSLECSTNFHCDFFQHLTQWFEHHATKLRYSHSFRTTCNMSTVSLLKS